MAAEFDATFPVYDDHGFPMVLQDASALVAWLNHEIELDVLEMLEDELGF
jgi:hypothetical protein